MLHRLPLDTISRCHGPPRVGQPRWSWEAETNGLEAHHRRKPQWGVGALVIHSVLKVGMVAGIVIALSACSGGGGAGGGAGTGTWSVTTGSAAHAWPPNRIAARSHVGTGALSTLAGGLLDLLLNVQTAYAAGVSGGTFSSSVGSNGSFGGSYSSMGPGGCTFTMTVSGSFSGTSATMTMSGSGCGMSMSGSGSGTMDVAWPNSTSFSGSYSVTVTGASSGTFSGSVSGRKV